MEQAAGANAYLDRHTTRLKDGIAALSGESADPQWAARATVEGLAVALQASLLVRHAPTAVSDAFCAARLGEDGGRRVFGTLPVGVDAEAIIDRALAT